MLKPPQKYFSKTNHFLSFLLGLFFGLAGISLLAALAIFILKINPENFFLNLDDYALVEEPQQISQDQQQGIDVSALAFSDADHYLGSAQAGQVFVVYLDYQSPHSARFYQTLKSFTAANSENIKIIWRHFPLDFNPQAKPAAQAAECAANQDAFWSYTDLIFNRRSELTYEFYLSLAQELNLDYQVFKTCLDNQETAELINTQIQEAVDTGISGTPNLIYLNSRADTFQYIGGSVNQDYLESLLK